MKQEKCNQKRIEKYGGMITVEAAFVLPFVWMVLMAIMYFGLYFVDLAKVYSACNEVLSYGCVSLDKGCDLGNGRINLKTLNNIPVYSISNTYALEEQELQERIKSQLNKKLLLLKMNTILVKVTSSRVEVTVTGKVSHGSWKIANYSLFNFSYHKEVERGDYAALLRKTDAFSE